MAGVRAVRLTGASTTLLVTAPDRRPAAARDRGPHPARSLALSAGVHALLALVLALLPTGTGAAAARARRSSVGSLELRVARAVEPQRWPTRDEALLPLDAPAPDSDVPDELVASVDPDPLWFDDPPPVAVPRAAPAPAAPAALADVPDDLFAAPEAAAPPPEPEPAEELLEEPPVEVPETPEEEVLEPDDDQLTSEAAPEVAGAEPEDAPQEADADSDVEGAGGDDEQPGLLDAPPPSYPPSARAMGKQGVVTLAIDVDPRGGVLAVRVRRSSGHRVLDEAARQKVVDAWRFRPRSGGEPDVRTYVERVVFRLP